MDLTDYASGCERLVEELLDSLGDFGERAVREEMRLMGGEAWIDWLFEHRTFIGAFVGMNDHNRNWELERLDAVEKRRVVIAAALHLNKASNLLHAAADALYQGDGDLRQTASAAGKSLNEMSDMMAVSVLKQLWPLPEPNPFN